MKFKSLALLMCLVISGLFYSVSYGLSSNTPVSDDPPVVVADYTYAGSGWWWIYGTVVDDNGGWNCTASFSDNGFPSTSFTVNLDEYGDFGFYYYKHHTVGLGYLEAWDTIGQKDTEVFDFPY